MIAGASIAARRPSATHLPSRSLLDLFARVLCRKRALPHRRIEIRLRAINQLFNSMDPSPFHEKDLDHDAEEFILSWVQEYHRHDPVTLVIHVAEPVDSPGAARDVERAVHNYFAYRAKLNRLDFRHMMKQGRISLVIGVTFLTICIVLGNFIAGWVNAPWSLLLREALMIGGWVAMWRPLQTYLYDWWPLRRRGQIFEKMSRMGVELKSPSTGLRSAPVQQSNCVPDSGNGGGALFFAQNEP
jgi:hypothetical protein